VRRDRAALVDVGVEISGPVQDERGEPHSRQDVPDVNLGVHE
jgi:hypothetical protein